MTEKPREKITGKALAEKLSRVRLLSLDVDGVLTDGGLYYSEDGGISRKFNVKDGVGIKRVQALGVELAIISAGASGSILHRSRTLGIVHVFTAVDDKLASLNTLCHQLGISLDDVAHMGDDVNDLPVMAVVGCPMTVADAVPEARDAALYVTQRSGGNGAVREVCDLIIKART